ncbi:EsaB/YukD family protein, partial [Streptomyces sp. NPDC005195]|uniref:EsaB/YukD family protein n=1 Tax=Streptomyces sp. NPDC005195 TaxID=3154561 RepID=UPI0033B62CB2
MSTAAPAVSPSSTEVCRLTIVHPGGRCDVSVPLTTSVGDLLPALLRHLPQSPQERGTPLVLQRLGEEPLDPDGTPESLGLRHGDQLHLRPADAALPALHFDDVADGVAHVVGARPDRWQPSTSRRLALSLAVLVLAAVSASLLSSDPGPFSAKCAGVITAVLLVTACVVASRPDGDRGAVLIAALGALAHGALEGLALRTGPHGHFTSGPAAVLVAARGVAVVAAVLLTLRPLPPV